MTEFVLRSEAQALNIERDARLSDGGEYRWTLTRTWDAGTGCVCWIMLNPSTADALKDDPTIRRCIHFSQSWGYRGLVVVNLYPFRSSSPAECREWADWERHGDWHTRDAIHFANLPLVVDTAKEADLVVAAWGAGLWDPAFAEHVVEEIQGGEEPWPDLYCLGTTRDGSPKHPMARGTHRVPDDAQPVLWSGYCAAGH